MWPQVRLCRPPSVCMLTTPSAHSVYIFSCGFFAFLGTHTLSLFLSFTHTHTNTHPHTHTHTHSRGTFVYISVLLFCIVLLVADNVLCYVLLL